MAEKQSGRIALNPELLPLSSSQAPGMATCMGPNHGAR